MVIAKYPSPSFIDTSKIEPNKFKVLLEIKQELLAADTYSCDTETTSKNKFEAKITRISFAVKDKAWSIRVKDYGIDVIKEVLNPVFLDPKKIVVFHNYAYDGIVFLFAGIFFKNKIADTLIMSWLIDEDARRYSHGLKECVLVELNYQMASFEESSGLFGDFVKYSMEDAIWTLKLYFHYLLKFKEWHLEDVFWSMEMPCAQILLNVEYRGVRLDGGKLKILKRESFEELEKLERLIHIFAGMGVEAQRNLQKEFKIILDSLKLENEERISNKQEELDINKLYLEKAVEKSKNLVPRKFDVASPLQCAKVLFDELKIGMKSDGSNQYSERGKITKSQPLGQFSTDDDTLSLMSMDDYPIADLILSYRAVNTRNNNFIKPLLDRCRIDEIAHPQFSQTRTVTGRLASKEPNFQNLPRKGGVRAAFISRKGYKIIRADYRQAELRLMAHMSKDTTMIEAYQNDKDIHQITADACGLKGKDGRQAAKAINFGLIYRESAKRLKHQLAAESGIIITLQEAEKFIKLYFSKYSKVKDFHKAVEELVISRLRANGKFGYVKLLSGRYRRLDAEYLSNYKTNYTAITQAINAVIQGGIADITKKAMIDIDNEFRNRGWCIPELGVFKAYLIGQIHDEILVEAEEELAEEALNIVQRTMEDAGLYYKIIVPMKTDGAIVDSLAKG